MPAISPTAAKNKKMFCLLFLNNRFYEYLYVIAISSYKFLFAGPAAVASGFNYWETSLSLTIGGILGFYLFYFFSSQIIRFFNRSFPGNPKPPKPGWVAKNRRRLILRKYGFPLLLVFGPSLLSIPLTAFIVRRWVQNRKYLFLYFCLSIIFWAFVFGTLAQLNVL